jgi:hypothetical protein
MSMKTPKIITSAAILLSFFSSGLFTTVRADENPSSISTVLDSSSLGSQNFTVPQTDPVSNIGTPNFGVPSSPEYYEISPVPEPSTFAISIVGIAGLFAARRIRKSATFCR